MTFSPQNYQKYTIYEGLKKYTEKGISITKDFSGVSPV